MTTEEIIVCETTEIAPILKSVETSVAEMLRNEFVPFIARAEKIAVAGKTICVTDVTQTADMKRAGEIRKELRQIRLAADKNRVRLKADSLAYGKAVQGMYNILDAIVSPAESHCDEQERFAEVQAAKEKAELLLSRKKLLDPFFGYYDQDVDFSALTQERFDLYLADTKKEYDDEIQREKDAAEAIKKEREEAAETVRKLAEKEVEIREKEKAFKAAEERKAQEARMLAMENQKKIDALNKNASEERAAMQKKIDDANREKIAAENIRIANERAAEIKRIEEEKAAERLRKKELAAPTVKRLLALADQIEKTELPIFSDELGIKVCAEIRTLFSKIAAHVRERANS